MITYTMLIEFMVIVEEEETVKTCVEMANDIGQMVCDEMTTANGNGNYDIKELFINHKKLHPSFVLHN